MASRLSSFLVELKRRKVYYVGLAYVGVAAGVVGVCDAGLPDLLWAKLQVPVGVLLLVGFPVALVLAWAYEVRPEEPRGVPEGTKGIAGDRKSIVVLPFDNMSPDPGDSFLAQGLTEEIITDLSHLQPLRVISRSSSMVLKGTQKDVRTIGRDLDVQYVLEGSVRKAGSELRITAQLIDATSDTHLWAQKYEGSLEDVFGMQEQISRSIVDALELHILPKTEHRLGGGRIGNLQAYEFYLKARSEIWSSFSEASYTRALELAERGLEIVGDDDLLHSIQGMAYFQFVNTLIKPPQTYESLLAQADSCAEKALELNPRSASAHALKGFINVNRGNPSGAVRHLVEALRLNPNDPDALQYLGFYSAAGGWDPAGSKRLLERLAKVDPLTPLNKGAMAWFHWWHEGKFTKAIEVWADFFSVLEEESSPVRFLHAYLSASAGRISEAEALVERLLSEFPTHLLTSLGVFLRHAWRGETRQALQSVTEDLEKAARWDDMWPIVMADAYALINEKERAFHWLEHGIEYGICHVPYFREHDPFLANLRGDGRFQELMEKAARLSGSLSAIARIDELV